MQFCLQHCSDASSPIVSYWGQSAASVCQCQQSKGRKLVREELKTDAKKVKSESPAKHS